MDFFNAWRRMDPKGRGCSVSRVIKLLYDSSTLVDPPEWHEPMKSAIEELTGDGDPRRLAKQLSWKLRHNRRRVIGGKFFDKVSDTHAREGLLWTVRDASELLVHKGGTTEGADFGASSQVRSSSPPTTADPTRGRVVFDTKTPTRGRF